MLRRPPTRIELKTEDKEEVRATAVRSERSRARCSSATTNDDDAKFEQLRRDYLKSRERGAEGASHADADAIRRLERERERARRLGLDRGTYDDEEDRN
jgi:hypothetical protein